VAGLVLTWSEFPERAAPGNVTDAMVRSLMAHYIPTVSILWAVGVLFLIFYPIDREKHEQNVAKLRALEAEAKARIVEDGSLGAPVR
jgi:Na+/melibiose symporter-like transporter